MHTVKIQADNTTYYIHHNSDWSGTVDICWVDPFQHQRLIRLPGTIFKVCGHNAAVNMAVHALEACYVDDEGKSDFDEVEIEKYRARHGARKKA